MQNYKNHKVDLSNCDSEPIQIIGRIQAHGFLLVIDKNTEIIEQVSTNVNQYLNQLPAFLLGKELASCLLPEEYAFIQGWLQQEFLDSPQIATWHQQPFFLFAHYSGNKIILEGEPFTSSSDQEKIKFNNLLAQLYRQLNQLDDLLPVAEAVANTFLQILNYDRIEVIQFDPEWNSEVIAEARTARLNSYLGHHFPASDIPAQARELLLQKHTRQIPDVNAPAVDIVPYDNPETRQPTNMLRSELRNPSEIHLEYVRNMEVAATISFSIVIKDKLWGLISCHNVEPVFTSVWRRQTCDQVIKTFAHVIQSLQEKRDIHQLKQYQQTEEKLVKRLNNNVNFREELFGQDLNILQLTAATGVALYLDQELTLLGETPSKEQVITIIDWLARNNLERLFCTRELGKHIPEATTYRQVASGLVALEISRYNKEYLLYFKPEIKETRIWAGNPEKPMVQDDYRIHPRKSFEKWEEVIKGKSQPWTMNEQEITQVFLKDLIAIRLRNQAQQMEKLNKDLQVAAEALQVKNNQLEDFAYIMSHNLRSPLVTIDGLHEFYTDEPNLDNATFAMERIKLISDNMSETIQDLNIILKTRIDNELPSIEVVLADVIKKEEENLAAIIAQTQAHIQTDLQVPSVKLPKIYVESLLHNLISNALKYQDPNRPAVVQIKSWQEQNRLHLSVTDNGLGMDLPRMGHKLFGLYKTFHVNKNAKGLGLYLTKMQIEALGGRITVSSEVGQGSTFIVSLPAA